MTVSAHAADPIAALTVELERAHTFVAEHLAAGYTDTIPASLLVITPSGQRARPLEFTLPLYIDPPLYGVVLLKSRHREIGTALGNKLKVTPSCVISMLEITGMSLADWIAELAEEAELPPRESDTPALVISAADAQGTVVRRHYALEKTYPNNRYVKERQLGTLTQQVTHDMDSEMADLWCAYRNARQKSPGRGFG